MKKTSGISVKDIALIGMMTATIEAAKDALSILPNVELVTLLIILYTLFFGRRILFVIPIFVILQGMLHGFGLWWFMYLYVWPILAFLTYLFRRQTSLIFWSAFSGLFGLFFGAFCSLVYLVTSGPAAALAWWVAGIPFDVLHGVSNAILCLALFKPLHFTLRKLKNAWF
ncbi:MAG: hypothetical protein LUH19_09435 [Lachnospiraceae bacterium]|nr:hypothetical protein [Lachnospiraceae bacterium]